MFLALYLDYKACVPSERPVEELGEKKGKKGKEKKGLPPVYRQARPSAFFPG